MLVGAGVEKKMSSIWNQFMQHSLAGLNRSRVAGFHPLGDTLATFSRFKIGFIMI
jgi:hypothetical protein